MNKIRAEYERIYPKSPDMVEYCMKQASSYVTLKNGRILVFKKHSIEKRFCFSTGYNGRQDEEMHDDARAMQAKAETDHNYFIEENMKSFAHMDRLLSENKEGKRLYTVNAYMSPSKIVCINEWVRMNKTELDQAYELVAEDIEAIKKQLIEEKEKFTKRLKTYLKRYGLTKVRAWTYLSD